ncbi:MAG TPA: hypothetical protein VGR95_03600 [Thermoanaerobaculia bacterium]|jgi:hypothetical protein|nr:hypothetical protein [Thermoanaerobaculia bacterium]
MDRRPLGTWVITVVFALLAAHMVVDYTRGYTVVRGRRVNMPVSRVERTGRAAMLALGCAGAVQLFRRRASAVPLFLTATLTDVAIATWELLRNATSRQIVLLLVLSLLSITGYAACFVYALSLRARGQLVD